MDDEIEDPLAAEVEALRLKMMEKLKSYVGQRCTPELIELMQGHLSEHVATLRSWGLEGPDLVIQYVGNGEVTIVEVPRVPAKDRPS